MSNPSSPKTISLRGSLSFLSVHVICLLAFWTGVSWTAVAAMFLFYVIRAFGLTGGYHRYFSHHSYKTSRVFQFILAWIGASAAQLGPLWWAGHHRDHHRYADTQFDIHSPVRDGFWWSHVGWVLCQDFVPTKEENMAEFIKFPEIKFLNKYHFLPPLTLVLFLFGLGWYFQLYVPTLHTTPTQMVIWGFFISTVILYHTTFMTNSVAHLLGSRRFKTKDESRNNLILAILTLGEGWHNNHHRYAASERQGFFWWEIDMTHYILSVFSWFGIVWDLKAPPHSIYEEAQRLDLELKVPRDF